MSWIADFDAGSREMPTLVHVTRVTSGGFLQGETYVPIIDTHKIRNENAKLRELVSGLHMAYVGALNECESMDAGLIWDHCEMVDAELAKSHARFEADRHRFDTAMSELGVEVDE